MMMSDVFDCICIEVEHLMGNLPRKPDALFVEYGVVDEQVDLTELKHYDISVGISEEESDNFEMILNEMVLPGLSRLFEMISAYKQDSYFVKSPMDNASIHLDKKELDRVIVYQQEIIKDDLVLRTTYHSLDGDYILSFDIILAPINS